MTLHSSFSRNFYWPLAQKIKGEYAKKALEKLNVSQWKSQNELISKQWQLVERTVKKAIHEIPYYKKKYAEIGWDFNKEQFSYNDFLNLPKLKKETLRDNLAEILNPNYNKRMTTGRTSGSTGQSLTMCYDSKHESYSDAGRWRAKKWWGIRPGSRHVSIWGRPFTGYRDKLSQKIKSYLMNNFLFSAFDLTEENLESITKRIFRIKPSIIYGYPSAIFPLSVYIKKNKMQTDRLGLKVIMTTAETITTQQRKLIEEVFGCKTANEYGCSETGGFVYECPQGGWHISCEHVFIEFLDHQGNPMPSGQNGEIYITHLTNDYMPLIRYKVGDFGAGLSGICECGRGLPMMKVAVTKESDIFTLSNNKTYSSEIFDYINLAVSKAFPNAILQFRVIQKDMDYFEIEFVGGSERYKNGVKIFDDKMREKLGSDINVDFKKVNKIHREPSGKLRYFISEIN